MGEVDPKTIFYNFHGDSGLIPAGSIKAKGKASFRDFYFESVIGFYSDAETNKFLCSPMVEILNM